MDKNIKLYLVNILDSIKAIDTYIKNLSLKQYAQDFKTQDAVNMRLQIIGESVSKLPQKIHNQTKDVPWIKIRGLRNLISHDYYALRPTIIWEIINSDLTVLRAVVETLLEHTSKKLR